MYQELLREAAELNIKVVEKHFKSKAKGLCKGNIIGISADIKDEREKTEVLAEEIAHALFTTGDILDMNVIENRQQEAAARMIARERLKGTPFKVLLRGLKERRGA